LVNLLRSAKSGSGWTFNDLDSYHISLNQVDVLPFFGLQMFDARKAPTAFAGITTTPVDQELLTNIDPGAMQQ
ncbi:hypothetical protein IW261DRAFT_1307018, partial [Armillaria novae-zelandiae]